MSKAVRRKFLVTIEIDGHTWKDIMADLRHLSYDMEKYEHGYDSVMGGCDVSHIVKTEIDPTMTPEKFTKDLNAYLESRKP